MKISPPLFQHQEVMAQAAVKNSRVLNTSDPGTGKTRGTIEGYLRRRSTLGACRLLVVAPLTILKSSWGDDITAFSNLKYAIAHGGETKRLAAFKSKAEVVLINHDGVKWLAKNPHLLEGFTDLVIDEFTAFKHRTSDRSKAMLKVSLKFDHITELSGTPDPNTVLDIWHPVFILDHGKRLGDRFFKFRSQVCKPEQVGPLPEHVKWVDKPGAADVVADAMADISVRFKLESCVDIPPNTLRYVYVDMPKKVMDAYRKMEEEAVLFVNDHSISRQVKAIHAGAKATKMLQILSGSVYDQNGNAVQIHNDRHEMVMQLVRERDHSVVAWNWKHECEALKSIADRLSIPYGVIAGDVSPKERTQVVEDFQAGKLQVVFCHPQSAGHGLTLTRGTATIWASPTHNAEHFQQLNRRIYRVSQTQKTETICIAARGTKETEVYDRLSGKLDRMVSLLDIFAGVTEDALQKSKSALCATTT